MPTPVWHYDGISAVRHEGMIVGRDDCFLLELPAGATEDFAWSALVNRGVRNGLVAYGLADRRGWQISFPDGAPPDIVRHLPVAPTYGRLIDRFGLAKASAVFLVVSACAVFVAVKIPDIVAPLVPTSWERKLGDAMIGDMGGRFCEAKAGREALDVLVARISGGRDDVRVHVANIGMVNAVALPGGNIVIFRGLLKEAASADEVAGVVSHELGHVRSRHVMQALLRQAGLSVLMGGFDGNAGGYVNALVASTFSREAEAQADRYAIASLKTARISPDETANFFKRLSAGEAKLGKAQAALGYMSSHPLSQDRERAFRASRVPGAAYRPVLTQAQWDALIDICHDDPDVAEDTGLFF